MTCIHVALFLIGELDDHLLPVGHKLDSDEDELDDSDYDGEDNATMVEGLGKAGTTKRRQLYKKMVCIVWL